MEKERARSILGLKEGATDKEIKLAYRRLAAAYHPDVNKEPSAAQRFQDINDARDTLSGKSMSENTTPAPEGTSADPIAKFFGL